MQLTPGLALLLLALPAAAQLARPGQPTPPQLLPDEVPVHVLPSPDVARLLREDEQSGQWPMRYGAVIPTALSCDQAGRWDTLPSGRLCWRLHLVSPGARSLGLLFTRFELPASGELYVYSPDRATVLGAFTRATRQANGMLAVQPVFGAELVLEYVQAADDEGRPELVLGEVVHDYRGILDALQLDAPLALSGGCLVDVNCPQGAGFQDIKRSVLFMLYSGTFCSAGLLNNTANDSTPYFLTANHCGDMTNSVAVFGYENTGCGPGGASQANTISGATLLAASVQFDSQLYRLSSTPPAAFEPFFAGWDRSLNHPGPAISISHPSGHPRKIARDDQAPMRNGTKFQVTWEYGKLEGGSSGSPLFSGAKRVIGPACCVSDFTCNGQWAMYGRFDGFWDQRALGQWLDPLAADPTGIDGHDPFNGQAIPYNGSGANPFLYTSTTPPTVGTTWKAEIDTSTLPFPLMTWIVGYVAPRAGVFLPQGELLVDLTTPRLFTSMAMSASGVARHSNPIPNLPVLIGQTAYTQGVLLVGGPVGLTNGVELRLR